MTTATICVCWRLATTKPVCLTSRCSSLQALESVHHAHKKHVAFADPFAALEGATAAAAAPNLVDLDDLYDAAVPSQPQVSPFGHVPAQNQQGLAYVNQLPQMTDALLQPAAAPHAQKQAAAQAKAPVAAAPGAPAPMAPRGNAAVEQQAGRKDPFADLFS